MTLIASLPQEEHSLVSLEHGWHLDLLNFVQHGAPKIVIALLLALIGQQILAFFVKRMQKSANAMVGNAHRAAQLRRPVGVADHRVGGFLHPLYKEGKNLLADESQ